MNKATDVFLCSPPFDGATKPRGGALGSYDSRAFVYILMPLIIVVVDRRKTNTRHFHTPYFYSYLHPHGSCCVLSICILIFSPFNLQCVFL